MFWEGSKAIPAVIYQPIKATNHDVSEDVWAKHWAACNIDRELEMCAKREISPQIISILKTLNNPLIVDAGCGVGTWMQYFRNQGFNNIVGVDSFVPALKVLTERGGRGVEGDVRHLPFENESVDAFLSFGVIEHFPENPTGCLREMERVLAPGGYLFLTVPLNSWMRRLVAHPVRNIYRRLRRANKVFFEYRFTASEITDFCRASGFEVLKCMTDDYGLSDLSLGLWLDIPVLRNGEPGELNQMGVLLSKMFRRLSPWFISSGVFVIGRKPNVR
jgi:SAM-dependent methyltransferase